MLDSNEVMNEGFRPLQKVSGAFSLSILLLLDDFLENLNLFLYNSANQVVEYQLISRPNRLLTKECHLMPKLEKKRVRKHCGRAPPGKD